MCRLTFFSSLLWLLRHFDEVIITLNNCHLLGARANGGRVVVECAILYAGHRHRIHVTSSSGHSRVKTLWCTGDACKMMNERLRAIIITGIIGWKWAAQYYKSNTTVPTLHCKIITMVVMMMLPLTGALHLFNLQSARAVAALFDSINDLAAPATAVTQSNQIVDLHVLL